MEKENKYYDIIEKLVKNHKKYTGLESILDDIIDDVYSHSEVILNTVTNETVINAYLAKVVSASIITVPKKLGVQQKTRTLSNVATLQYEQPKVDNKLVDKMINGTTISDYSAVNSSAEIKLEVNKSEEKCLNINEQESVSNETASGRNTINMLKEELDMTADNSQAEKSLELGEVNSNFIDNISSQADITNDSLKDQFNNIEQAEDTDNILAGLVESSSVTSEVSSTNNEESLSNIDIADNFISEESVDNVTDIKELNLSETRDPAVSSERITETSASIEAGNIDLLPTDTEEKVLLSHTSEESFISPQDSINQIDDIRANAIVPEMESGIESNIDVLDISDERNDDNEDTDVLPLEMESNSTVEMEDSFIEPVEEKLDDNEDTDVLPLEMESNSIVEMEDSFIEPAEEKLDDNEDTDVLPLEMESNSTVEMEDRFIEPAEEKLDDNEDTDVLPLEMESNSTVEREDSFIEQPEEKLDDNLEISAESDESFSNLTIEGSLDNVSALNEQLDIEDSILPDFDTNDDLSLDSEDSELLLEPADQETDLTEFEADINVNRDELPLSAENDFDLVLVPEESQDKEVLEMQETNALTLNANTQNDSNINTNLADYTKFRFEPVNAATLRDDIDADLVIRDLEELSKRNPKLNILDVYSLKYCEGQTITEVASNLQMSEDSVVEALNEILSVI